MAPVANQQASGVRPYAAEDKIDKRVDCIPEQMVCMMCCPVCLVLSCSLFVVAHPWPVILQHVGHKGSRREEAMNAALLIGNVLIRCKVVMCGRICLNSPRAKSLLFLKIMQT